MRFYAVGEYGDETWRPHYHLAIFGHDTCQRGRTLRRPGSSRPQWEACCSICRLVGETWGYGDVDLGTLETDSAQYLAGYVTKKLTASDDTRLLGRHPEFSRMSLRPGIGYGALHDVASTLMEYGLENDIDVPGALRHGGRVLPLGRYLQRNLRKMVGRDEKTPPAKLAEIEAQMLALRQAAFDDNTSLKWKILEANEQKRLSFYAKQKLYKKGKTL